MYWKARIQPKSMIFYCIQGSSLIKVSCISYIYGPTLKQLTFIVMQITFLENLKFKPNTIQRI